MAFQKGQKIAIVGGKYKRFGTGTFLRYAGDTKAAIRIHGDSVNERNLMLTSIAEVKKDNAENISISIDDYNSMLEEIKALTLMVKALELKINSFNVK